MLCLGGHRPGSVATYVVSQMLWSVHLSYIYCINECRNPKKTVQDASCHILLTMQLINQLHSYPYGYMPSTYY